MSEPAGNASEPSRIGVFGDLPARFLQYSMPRVPWYLEGILIAFWSSLFFLIAGEQRRAVVGNLRAIFPRRGWLCTCGGAWLVFFRFSLTYVDARRCATGTGGVDWEIEGRAHLDEMAGLPRGLLLVTAHMGNYDLAATFFASRFPRVLHIVRAPERGGKAQEMRENELRASERENPAFRCHYNDGGSLLGIELARLIATGDAVAVQADRVVGEVSSMEVEVEPGLIMKLPKGPWALARATRCACFPLFVTRTGWRRYRITVRPSFREPDGRTDAAESARRWADSIYREARDRWHQWFVYEPIFTRRSDGQ